MGLFGLEIWPLPRFSTYSKVDLFHIFIVLVNTSLFFFKTTRNVVWYGTYDKHLKVEVYLIEFKLCVHPRVNNTRTFFFSRADSIGECTCGSVCTLYNCQ